MSEVAVQVVYRFYVCQHKNIKRTFLVINGAYNESIPCCVDEGCHGYQMMRTTRLGVNKVHTISEEPAGVRREGFWEESFPRDIIDAEPV